MSQSPTPCEICKGACCESLVFPAFNEDLREFLEVRGRMVDDYHAEVETRCPKLTACGRCSIHDTRPVTCRLYAVGSKACLDTVDRRRTGEQREAILAAIKAQVS
jgi:Fe-S-cluster containining protein